MGYYEKNLILHLPDTTFLRADPPEMTKRRLKAQFENDLLELTICAEYNPELFHPTALGHVGFIAILLSTNSEVSTLQTWTSQAITQHLPFHRSLSMDHSQHS